MSDRSSRHAFAVVYELKCTSVLIWLVNVPERSSHAGIAGRADAWGSLRDDATSSLISSAAGIAGLTAVPGATLSAPHDGDNFT